MSKTDRNGKNDRERWFQAALWRDAMVSRLTTAYEALTEAVAGAPSSQERIFAERALADVRRARDEAKHGAAMARARCGVRE